MPARGPARQSGSSSPKEVSPGRRRPGQMMRAPVLWPRRPPGQPAPMAPAGPPARLQRRRSGRPADLLHLRRHMRPRQPAHRLRPPDPPA